MMPPPKTLPDDVHARFPKASRYDLAWVTENEMGPNTLWLTEFLCEKMRLERLLGREYVAPAHHPRPVDRRYGDAPLALGPTRP